MKDYEGRLTRSLSQLENWAKNYYQDENSKTFLYEHTTEVDFDEITGAIATISCIRDQLKEWVRE